MTEPRTFPGIALRGAWPLGSNTWKPEMDDNLRKLSALVQLVVKSRLAAVPGSPTNGDMYILTGGANVDAVAVYDDGGWIYFQPIEGWRAYDAATNEKLIFNGSDWIVDASGGGGIDDAPSDGATYGRKDGGWIEVVSGVDTLAELGDVDFTTLPTNGQTLAFNGTSGKWEPQAQNLTTYSINNQAGGAYTLTTGDRSKIVRMTSAAANNVTVPTGLTIGATWIIRQAGDGKTGIVAASGVTINSAETLYLRKKGSTVSLVCVAANEFDLTGDLEIL